MEEENIYLAHRLEDRNDFLKVANMEHRQNQSNVAKVTVAFDELLTTCFTVITFVGHAHAFVERAMRVDGSIVLQIKESSIGYLDERLMDDIGIRAVILATNIKVYEDLHYSKLKLFDRFWSLINHLMLSCRLSFWIGGVHIDRESMAFTLRYQLI